MPRKMSASAPTISRKETDDFELFVVFRFVEGFRFFANSLWDAIAHPIDLFEPQESANYFAAAGYDPDPL